MGGVNYRTWPNWLAQLAVVFGYIALFAVIHPFSDAHWSLTAGLRLSALLLLPSRYWLALAVGDGLYSLPQAITCEPRFGVLWSLQYCFPLTAIAMPIVWYCKEKLSLFPMKHLVNLNAFIACTLTCSIAWSLYNVGGLWLIPNRGYNIDAILLGSLFVGSYVAVLTIVPWAILAKLGYHAGTLKISLRTFVRSPLFSDACLIVVPSLLVLSWLTYRAAGSTKPVWALFGFAPFVWLTFRHGWRGTVFGGTLTVASICLLFTWDGNIPDTEVVQVQAIIAFAITCLIAMSPRISAMRGADEMEKANTRQAMQLARQSMIASEVRLKQGILIKGMGMNYRAWPNWLTQLAVVFGYIALFAIIRPFSDAHWSLTAGLRLSALLLLPSRYWFALVIGDALYALPQAITCEPQFGLLWAIGYTLPLTAVAMPGVWWCKEKLSLFPNKRLVNFNAFILCAIASSACWSLFDLADLYLADLWHVPNRGYDITPLLFGSMFIGSFVAVLTIVPWVIMAKLTYRAGTLKTGLRAFARSSLFFDATLVVLPALLILSWLTYRASDATKPIWALFMFAPCVWLTLRHGWRATVIAGSMTVASICLLFTWTGNSPDSLVVQVQAIIAFAITCLIAMGARISAMRDADEMEKASARQAMQLARQSMIVSEMRLKQASETLEQVCAEMQLNQNRLLNRFRLMLPVNESLDYTKQASSTQEKVYQLADAMHPIAWRRRGLIAALRENIGRALDDMGIAYLCKVMGRGLSLTGKNLHTMIYRLACESVVHVCGNLRCTSVRLLVRGGYVDGQRIVILRVEGVMEDAFKDAYPLDGPKNQLASKLGASKLDLHQLRDNARLFNGELHVRATAQKIRITILLVDTEQKEREYKAPSPFSLWAG